MKRFLAVFLVLSVTAIIVFVYRGNIPTDVYSSPDGNYTLEVYRQKTFFAMPGQSSDAMASIIVKNRQGEILGEITNECGIMYQDIEVNWDLPAHWVSYGMAHGFNLNTGLCEC